MNTYSNENKADYSEEEKLQIMKEVMETLTELNLKKLREVSTSLAKVKRQTR